MLEKYYLKARWYYYRLCKKIGYSLVPKKIRKRYQQWYYNKYSDVILVSFPKCGRTWLHTMMGKVFHQLFPEHVSEKDILNFKELHYQHPDIPFIQKTHADADNYGTNPPGPKKNIQVYRNKKIVYMYRHPLDVLSSFYHHRAHRKSNSSESKINLSLSEFLDRPELGIEKIVNYYNIWAEKLSLLEKTFSISYEQLHENPKKVLEELFQFLGFSDIPNEYFQNAIEFSQFDNMRKMEKDNYFNTSSLKPKNKNDDTTFKTRKGKTGSYKEDLPDPAIPNLENFIKNELHPFYNEYK